jgi:DNA repair protein RadC
MEHHIGHRERIRERLLNSKTGSLQDYELLELLLCLALPRKDTKVLAKDLIYKYGSFAKVISAEKEALLEIKGVGKSVLSCLKLVKESSARLLKEEIIDRPVISSWQKLIDYCRINMGHLKKEVFMVMYLNSQNSLIEEDLNEYGTVDQISVYPREITKRALFLNASSVILVHNHPGGSTKASKADIETTKHIVSALSPFKIRVHDHLIISDKSFFSFKSEGLL